MPNKPKRLSQSDLQEIEAMAGLGMRFEDIAFIKNISADTLSKHARKELRRGKAKTRGTVMKTAYELAISGKCPAMTMFWLKTQAGWSENRMQETLLAHPKLDQWLQGANNSSKATCDLLAQIIEWVRQGEITPRVGSAIATLVRERNKTIAQGELEERLSILESFLKGQETQPLDLGIEDEEDDPNNSRKNTKWRMTS